MDKNLRKMIDGLELRKAATIDAINNFENSSGINLPNEYKAFLKTTNGGEGFIGKNSYVMLWAVEELLELNESYAVDEFAPGLLIFGSNGGGEAYAFDTRSKNMEIVQVPFVGMDLDLLQNLAVTFDDFIKKLYYAEEDE
jgi:hypothetical protein